MSDKMQLDEALKPKPDQITVNRQRMAADPKQSAWVSANAGSGKTYVLSTRVIRLLLEGVDPSKILCLTYTKTAAAEMKNRVFTRLGAWVTMDDTALSKALSEITDKTTQPAQLNFARTLFARALETPGGLKIQTIHAFCEALLHRFPLEANIAGHFELIDEMASGFLVAEARRQLLTGKADEARGAIHRVLASKGESGLEALLDEIIGKREKLSALIGRLGNDPVERRNRYLNAFGFADTEDAQSIKASIWKNFPLDLSLMKSVRDEAGAMGKARAHEFGYGCVVALEHAAKPSGFDMLRSVILKSDGGIYKSNYLFAKDVSNKFPMLAERYQEAAEIVSDTVERLNLLAEIEQTLDALAIADRLIKLYTKLKHLRGLLDFEDLIVRTEKMLSKPNVAAWVRMKLDQGIDHILVDEAQDTSPAQWRVIKTLADEFFDGEGARDTTRTVFAVGDEKQSIYSFQGADPAEFGDARDYFAQKLRQIEQPFESVELDASFRSTGDVLKAVDHVFAYADHKKGLTTQELKALKHESLRLNQPGQVEVWDVVSAVTNEEEEDWRLAVDHAQKPAIIVAKRIAARIKAWLDEEERIEASGRKMRAGDILVLVRKRDAFVHALSKALKEYEIPVAGADRLAMTGHIAVLDLIALGRVMLNQADDLSLAALLRSPLFGWSDEQLFDLSYDRDAKPLYVRLGEMTGSAPHITNAYTQLAQWKTLALNRPVFEFYSHVLGVTKGRAKLVARLGPETADMVDEFLNFAIAQEKTGPVSLETFIATLDNFGPEIKREMDGERNEVRIMTVHGAKGLEAPIVFLVDPGSAAFTARSAPLLLPYDMPDHLNHTVKAVLWGGSGADKSSVATAIVEGLKEKTIEEYNRLLYVGMTRAADRLVVAGYAGVNAPKEGTWRKMVETGLAQHSRPIQYDEFVALRFPAQQVLTPHPPRDDEQTLTQLPHAVPACFSAPAPLEPPAARPLVPSGASGLAIEADRQDGDGETASSLLSQFQTFGDAQEISPTMAAKRGTLIHKLLQMLPDITPDERHERAFKYCQHIDHRWSDGDIEEILAQVFGVLDHSDYANFFVTGAHAEVSVMGTVKIGDADQAVSGVIDRLSVSENAVHIIDYKTNANPPHTHGAIPPVYMRQMALYHALVAPLYPDKQIKSALLFTATPQLMILEDGALIAALRDIAPRS